MQENHKEISKNIDSHFTYSADSGNISETYSGCAMLCVSLVAIHQVYVDPKKTSLPPGAR